MAKRTTSHAKEIHLDSDKPSPLDRYGVVTSHFEHARDPEVSNTHWEIHEEREAEKAKAAEEAERGSFLDREESLLPTYKDEADRRMGINQDTGISADSVIDRSSQSSGSEDGKSSGSIMVEQAGAKYEMQPPDTRETRQQNAQTHATLMAKDDYLSRSYQEALANGPPPEKGHENAWAAEPETMKANDKDDGWER